MTNISLNVTINTRCTNDLIVRPVRINGSNSKSSRTRFFETTTYRINFVEKLLRWLNADRTNLMEIKARGRESV